MSHARCSPSGAFRWMSCPGSVREEARYPQTTNQHAETGTLIHEVAAKALTEGAAVQPDARLNADHLRIATEYVNFVRSLDAETY